MSITSIVESELEDGIGPDLLEEVYGGDPQSQLSLQKLEQADNSYLKLMSVEDQIYLVVNNSVTNPGDPLTFSPDHGYSPLFYRLIEESPGASQNGSNIEGIIYVEIVPCPSADDPGVAREYLDLYQRYISNDTIKSEVSPELQTHLQNLAGGQLH